MLVTLFCGTFVLYKNIITVILSILPIDKITSHAAIILVIYIYIKYTYILMYLM